MKDIALAAAFLLIFGVLLFIGVVLKSLPFIFALSLFN